MRRFNVLLLNLIVVAGLAFGSVPLGLSTASAVTSQLQVAPASSGEVALAARQAKREHKKDGKKTHKQDGKKKDGKKTGKKKAGKKSGKQNGKQKDHKKKDRKRSKGRAAELTTGILPGADTVAPDPEAGPTSAENRYIVVLKSGAGSERAAANDIAADAGGVIPTHVYEYVFPGFAAFIPGDKVDDVRNDPRVETVVPDGLVHAFAQELPTGVNRIDADTNDTANINNGDDRIDVDVAVLDTAGNDKHEDLNIHAWGNCTPSHFNGDDDGHGTHVGGTIGALDNNIGVVGVAPGARLWNIRVLVKGSGFDSWIICGLDLVEKYAQDQDDGLGDIEVANLSLGGDGEDSNCGTDLDDVEHLAYCRVVAAGVTVVVAAGNESDDAANHTPAAYDEVITVSALADSDGLPGGLGPNPRPGEPDDSLALFSNFGADVDIAAPGRDILSTVPKGSCDLCDASGYTELSGTSMASPHVAGAAALYLATNPGASPQEVKDALIDARENIALPNDNQDAFDEGVLNVADDFGTSSTSADSQASADSDRVTADTKGKKATKGKKVKKDRKGKKVKKGSKTRKRGKK